MVQSIHVRSYRPFALFLILSLLLLISGCRGPRHRPLMLRI